MHTITALCWGGPLASIANVLEIEIVFGLRARVALYCVTGTIKEEHITRWSEWNVIAGIYITHILEGIDSILIVGTVPIVFCTLIWILLFAIKVDVTIDDQILYNNIINILLETIF